MYRYFESFAESIETIELVVNQRFEGANVKSTDTTTRLFNHPRANRQECGFSFTSRRRSRDDHIAAAIEDWVNRCLLNVTQVTPTLLPDPALDTFVHSLEPSG